jgi:hypothetical protein
MPQPAPIGSGPLARRAFILAALFLFAVGGAWAWYNVNPRKFETAYTFSFRESPAGWTYQAFPVDPTAVEILSTTNLVNGIFRPEGKRGPEFGVFMGTWDAAVSKQMGVVAHTPDICWVGAGFVPVSLGQPGSTELEFNGTRVPFELRAFKAPDGSFHELTLWCTLVSGQVYEESVRFEPETPRAGNGAKDALTLRDESSRVHLRSQFLRILGNRIPGDGSKQFVRYSTRIEDRNWEPALKRLKDFAQVWLSLAVTHPSAGEPLHPK